MYPCMKDIHRPIISASCHTGNGELLSITMDTILKGFADADEARDLQDCRSISSSVWMLFNVIVAWICKKQIGVSLHSNNSELASLLVCVKKTVAIRHLLHCLGYPQLAPTIISEHNQATIAEVTNNCLTPQVHHLDTMITWLHENFIKKILLLKYTNTKCQKADLNTKPHGGESLKSMLLPLIGYSFYPPSNSEHYKLLQLDLYNITPDRTSQRSFIPTDK